MNYNFLGLLVASLCSISSQSQNIKGVVRSQSGKAIAFAYINVLNSNKNTSSDKAGNFSFDLPEGEYKIAAVAFGYTANTKLVRVTLPYTLIEITLTEDSKSLEEVVVTGTKIAVAKNYTPLNITVVNREQIENSSESALLPVLAEQVPGLFVTERGVTGFGVGTGAAGAISMRGLSGSPNIRILVLINGSPQFMGIFGHPLADAYVASDVEKVEVIHGPSSVMYGTNAMGGVINIITRNQPNDGYAVNARALYGSYNTQKYMFNMGYRKKGLSLMASVNRDRTDGHRASSNFNITNGYLKMNYHFAEHFNIGVETNIATYTAADPGPEGGLPGATTDISRGSSYMNFSNNYRLSSGNLQFFYNFGKHKISDGFRSTDANYGFSFYQSFRHIKNNVSTLGFDFKKYGGEAANIFAMNGQGIKFGDHTITEWAPYLYSQQTIARKFILSAGIRLEHNSNYGNITVPSGGISYLANGNTTLKAAVSKGFRSPTIMELYLFAPANSALQPEKMMNYELTINQLLADNKIKLEATLFKVNGDNLIQTVLVNGGPKNTNTGSFNNIGIESSIKYAINQELSIRVGYGYTDLKNPVLAVPRHQLVVSNNFTSKKWQLNLTFQYISGLYTQVKPVLQQVGYFLVNARAGYKINRFFDVFVKGENLADQDYQINKGYPMPGITLFGGVNFHFAKQQ